MNGPAVALLGRSRVPDSQRAIRAARHQTAVETECNGADLVAMSFTAADFLAGRHVPEPDRAIPARRRDRLAVRSKSDGADLIDMALANVPQLAGRDVPEAKRPIIAAGGERDAVGREDR